jgi:hypothetical protein
MTLCYNFTRVLNILGLDRFMAYLAKRRHSNWTILLLNAAIAVTDRPQIGSPRLRVKISHTAALIRTAFSYAPAGHEFLPSLGRVTRQFTRSARSLRSQYPQQQGGDRARGYQARQCASLSLAWQLPRPYCLPLCSPGTSLDHEYLHMVQVRAVRAGASPW